MLRRAFFVFLVAFAALAGVPASADVRTAADSGLSIDRGPSVQRHGVATRHPLVVDLRDLERAVASDRLLLPSTGAPMPARSARVRHRADGTAIVTAVVDTELGPQSAVLAIGREATFGFLPQRSGAALRVETRGGRTWVVEGGIDFTTRSPDFLHVPPPTPAQRALRLKQDSAKAAGTPNVDVVVLYTSTLVSVWGSDAAMRTRIAYLEALTNQAYVDSDVGQTITVVGAYLVSHTRTDDDNEVVLDELTDGNTALSVYGHRLRDLHGADLVAMLRDFDRAHHTTCGVGWLGGYGGQAFSPDWGFSVSGDHGFGEDHCGEWTFAHELGHNMGAHHDFDTAEGDHGAYEYSRGFRRTLTASSGFATVMAYQDGPQERLGQFSNPRLARCLGQPCGDAATADNARGMTQSAPTVAGFAAAPAASGPALVVGDASVVEGDSGTRVVRVPLTLSAPATAAVSVDVETTNGSAIFSDFTPGSGVVRIAAGQTTGFFDVLVKGDTEVERDEVFGVTVTAIAGARVADGQGIVTIENDEAIPRFSLADAAVVEGDAGTTALTFTASLSSPSASPVVFDVEITEYPGGAIAPDDYVAQSWEALTMPAGETDLQFSITVVGDTVAEDDERLRLVASRLRGAEIERDWARGWILDDDTAVNTAPIAARDDRFDVVPGASASLDVLANDVLGAAFSGGTFAVTSVSAGGSATPDIAPDFPDSTIAYRPRAGFFGDETIGYRACEAAPSSRCVTGRAVAVVRPVATVEVDATDGVAGWTPVAGAHEPLTADPTRYAGAYAMTPLVAPEVVAVPLSPDATPHTPWDATPYPKPVLVRTLPAPGGAPTTWILRVEIEPTETSDIDVYVGIDADGGQDADASETRCTAAMRTPGARQTCELRIVHPGSGVTRYWVLPHASGGDTAPLARVSLYEVPLIAGDGSLTVTGPGLPSRDAPVPMRVSWFDPTLLPGTRRVGYAAARMHEAQAPAWFPVAVTRPDTTSAPLALRDGVPLALALAPRESQTRLFVDVPRGASSLTVTTTSAQRVDLYLARDATPSSPHIDAAPSSSQAAATLSTGTGTGTLTLSGTQLSPGRWYVVPRNPDMSTAAQLEVTAHIAGAAMPPRPGSYFDAARSGHGVFLYPAGGQWAGLWYTYFEDGTPTWYYLQGAAPGADGIWSGELYRTMWDGDSQTVVGVGRAAVTPTGPDAFVYTWSIDGETGSEPMASLGRGCPTLGGQAVDASSHWFNPATAGTGHSVQFWSTYEFFAAFVYDDAGVPRFLTAEKNGFAGADATMPIEQLQGFCPLCTRTGAPLRRTVGTLRRVLAGGTLRELGVEATFATPVTGTWSRFETVQTLGGPGTTQGCAP